MGFIVLMNHTVFDGVYFIAWRKDVAALIQGGNVSPKVSFKSFANAYSQYKDSPPSQRAVDFHSKCLRGIGELSGALWPPLGNRKDITAKIGKNGPMLGNMKKGLPNAQVSLKPSKDESSSLGI